MSKIELNLIYFTCHVDYQKTLQYKHRRTASYEITLVRPSLRLSVRHYFFSRLAHLLFLMLYMMITDHDI